MEGIWRDVNMEVWKYAEYGGMRYGKEGSN